MPQQEKTTKHSPRHQLHQKFQIFTNKVSTQLEEDDSGLPALASHSSIHNIVAEEDPTENREETANGTSEITN